MEQSFVLDGTINVPIGELEKALLEYVAQMKKLGTERIALHKLFLDGETMSDSCEKTSPPPISSFPSLHSFYLSLSPSLFSPCPSTGEIFEQIKISPLEVFEEIKTSLARVPRVCAREKDLPGNRKRLNRGIPAPEYVPTISITYDRPDNNTPTKTSRALVRANTTKQTIEVISYWNSKPGLTRHHLPKDGTCTRRYKKANYIIDQLINGRMFQLTKLKTQDRKFPIEDIFAAIDKFNLVCTDLKFSPRNKESIRRFSFNRFVYDDYADSSWFLKCINDDLQLSAEVSMQNYLRPWYGAIKDAYLCSRSSNYKHMSDNDTENILKAAKSLYYFQRRVAPDLSYAEAAIQPLSPLVWCGWLFEALDNKISPSRLADPKSCNYFLYSYLIKRGRLPGTQVAAPMPVSTFSIYEQAL